MIVTFCGHARVDYPPSVREDTLAVLRRLSESGEELEFLIGGYGNFDSLALMCARTLQKEGVRVRACFVSPYVGGSYSGVLARAKELFDEIVCPPLESVPPRAAIVRRNFWMVERADAVVACVIFGGGAAKTLNYAVKKHKPIFRISF